MFLKPTSSYLENGGTIEIPHSLDSLHHEVELALVIGHKARDVPERLAMDYIGGIFTSLPVSLLRSNIKDIRINVFNFSKLEIYVLVHHGMR